MSSHPISRAPGAVVAAVFAAVALAACTVDTPDLTDPTVETPITPDGATEPDDGSADTDADSDDTRSDDAPGTSGNIPEEYAGVLAAIPLAEAHAGGFAFELDDGDGGIWEVHVAVGGDDIEVHVDASGSDVISSEREADLGSDDAAGLDAAGIGLAEAIEIAIVEYGGTAPVDDAGISDEGGGAYAWEVAFADDVEVYLDITDGTVLRVETE